MRFEPQQHFIGLAITPDKRASVYTSQHNVTTRPDHLWVAPPDALMPPPIQIIQELVRIPPVFLHLDEQLQHHARPQHCLDIMPRLGADPSGDITAIHDLIRAGSSCPYGSVDFRQMIFQNGQLKSGKRNHRKSSTLQVLFVDQCLVSCQQNIHTILFRHAEQRSILESGPPHVSDCHHFVVAQQTSDGVVKVFVKQHLHWELAVRCSWANSISRCIWASVSEGNPSRSSSSVSPSS